MKKGELGIMPKSLATFSILNSRFLILNSQFSILREAGVLVLISGLSMFCEYPTQSSENLFPTSSVALGRSG